MSRSPSSERESDVVAAAAVVSDNSVSVRSELLCFIVAKCRIIPVDDLAQICVNFYREEEIFAARGVIKGAGTRLVNRKGGDKLKATVKDLIKVVLDPNNIDVIPVCYATDLSRLPPVDMTHCDMSAVLMELQGLRAELRSMSHLQEEVVSLRQQVQTLKTEMDKFPALGNFPTLPSSNVANHSTTQLRGSEAAISTATVVREAATTGALLSQRPTKRPVNKPKPVVGASTRIVNLKAVNTTRRVEVFVSRLDPHTVANELVDTVQTVALAEKLNIVDVTCNQLESKYKHLYSSFHVSVCVNSSDMKSAIDVLMSADSWPVGVFVKRYFHPRVKDGNNE